jgi:hypothetical protein
MVFQPLWYIDLSALPLGSKLFPLVPCTCFCFRCLATWQVVFSFFPRFCLGLLDGPLGSPFLVFAAWGGNARTPPWGLVICAFI